MLRNSCFTICLIVFGFPAMVDALGDRTPAQDATTVRILLAFDKNANIASFDRTRDAIIDVFRNAKRAGLPLTISEVPVDNVSSRSILQAIEDVRVGPDETLVFFYHGHGGTDPHYGHFLNPRGGHSGRDLLRSQLRQKIAERNARCTIILTDCCSSRGRANFAYLGAGAMDLNVLQCLFLRHRGLVDVTAATYDPETQIGEYGWINPASTSLFSGSFAKGLSSARTVDIDENNDGIVEWKEFLPKVNSILAEEFRELKSLVREGRIDFSDHERKKLFNQQAQRLQAFSCGTIWDRAFDPGPQRARGRFGATIVENYGFGLVVVGTTPGSPSRRIYELNGVQLANFSYFLPGDLILAVNGKRVASAQNFRDILDSQPPGAVLELTGRDAAYAWRRRYSAKVRLNGN